jgi:hypothetical protein
MRWDLGRVIPPHICDELNLTPEQERQLHALEKDVKDRVMKMLTSEQKKKLSTLQRRGTGSLPPGGPDAGPPRGPGQPPGDDGPPPNQPRRNPPRGGHGQPPGRPDDGPPPDDRQASNEPGSGGIQWFATWEGGLREASRSGRPILLVSAAPHCAGVPGVW